MRPLSQLSAIGFNLQTLSGTIRGLQSSHRLIVRQFSQSSPKNADSNILIPTRVEKKVIKNFIDIIHGSLKPKLDPSIYLHDQTFPVPDQLIRSISDQLFDAIRTSDQNLLEETQNFPDKKLLYLSGLDFPSFPEMPEIPARGNFCLTDSQARELIENNFISSCFMQALLYPQYEIARMDYTHALLFETRRDVADEGSALHSDRAYDQDSYGVSTLICMRSDGKTYTYIFDTKKIIEKINPASLEILAQDFFYTEGKEKFGPFKIWNPQTGEIKIDFNIDVGALFLVNESGNNNYSQALEELVWAFYNTAPKKVVLQNNETLSYQNLIHARGYVDEKLNENVALSNLNNFYRISTTKFDERNLSEEEIAKEKTEMAAEPSRIISPQSFVKKIPSEENQKQ